MVEADAQVTSLRINLIKYPRMLTGFVINAGAKVPGFSSGILSGLVVRVYCGRSEKLNWNTYGLTHRNLFHHAAKVKVERFLILFRVWLIAEEVYVLENI